MAWARLDDRFHDHPKVIAAGPEAIGVFVMCLTWAHHARRTTPHPGVVPEAVLARFATPRRSQKVSSILRGVGLFDDLTRDGWPVHDFTDYLPKYDPQQAKEAGQRGGLARAAKQTASEPLDGPLEDRQADDEQTSSTRASARRNPVPVPGSSNEEQPPSLRSGGAAKRAARIPTNFDLDAELRQWSRDAGFDDGQIDYVLEQFKNHWESAGGQSSRKVDWRKAWQVWLRKETPARTPRLGGNGAGPARPAVGPQRGHRTDGQLMPWER